MEQTTERVVGGIGERVMDYPLSDKLNLKKGKYYAKAHFGY
jgi:hypothetical protein